jgi:hypothetical protein
MANNYDPSREQMPGATARAPQKAEDPYATSEITFRCIRCNAPVAGALCGRKAPCASCGHPYPLGDCSDLAEN